MTWSTVHDEMLCREILVVVDLFTGTKKGTVARGTKWEEVAENLNKIQQVYFKFDQRAVRDYYNLLASASLGISFFVKRNSALHSVSSIASKSNLSWSSYGNSGFFEKFPSYSKINSSSSIIPSLQLSRRRFLASLKDFIAVIKRKISASPPYTKIHDLKYFVFGGYDGTRPSLTLRVPSPS